MIKLTDEEKESLVELIEYMYEEEISHYEEEPTKTHIFNDVQKLAKALEAKGELPFKTREPEVE